MSQRLRAVLVLKSAIIWHSFRRRSANNIINGLCFPMLCLKFYISRAWYYVIRVLSDWPRRCTNVPVSNLLCCFILASLCCIPLRLLSFNLSLNLCLFRKRNIRSKSIQLVTFKIIVKITNVVIFNDWQTIGYQLFILVATYIVITFDCKLIGIAIVFVLQILLSRKSIDFISDNLLQ